MHFDHAPRSSRGSVKASLAGAAGHVAAARRYGPRAPDAWNPRTLFPGKAASAQGWCKGGVATP